MPRWEMKMPAKGHVRGVFRYMGVNDCDGEEEVDNDENFEENWDYRKYQGAIL